MHNLDPANLSALYPYGDTRYQFKPFPAAASEIGPLHDSAPQPEIVVLAQPRFVGKDPFCCRQSIKLSHCLGCLCTILVTSHPSALGQSFTFPSASFLFSRAFDEQACLAQGCRSTSIHRLTDAVRRSAPFGQPLAITLFAPGPDLSSSEPALPSFPALPSRIGNARVAISLSDLPSSR